MSYNFVMRHDDYSQCLLVYDLESKTSREYNNIRGYEHFNTGNVIFATNIDVIYNDILRRDNAYMNLRILELQIVSSSMHIVKAHVHNDAITINLNTGARHTFDIHTRPDQNSLYEVVYLTETNMYNQSAECVLNRDVIYTEYYLRTVLSNVFNKTTLKTITTAIHGYNNDVSFRNYR